MSQKIIAEYLKARDSGNRVNAPRVQLTQSTIRDLPTKTYDYAIGEATVPALTVRVRKDTGNKTFEVVKKVNGRMARSKVCTFGERPYAKGDESVIVTARAIIAKMDKGVTRSEEKTQARSKSTAAARQALTVLTACDNYINAKIRSYLTTKNYERFRDNHLTDLHHRQLSSITEDDVSDLFDGISKRTGPVAGNNVIRFFRAVWKHHRRKYGLGDSPTIIFTNDGDNVKRWNTENRKTRYIHREELNDWWNAVEQLRTHYIGDGDLAADYLQFALLTGLRRREITGLNWEDINRRRNTFLVAENKSKRPHIVPLTPTLLEILDRRKSESRPFQIEEPKNFIAKVTQWCEVPFSSHDLRRTYLSYANAPEVAIPMTVQKALVNHSRQSDVTDGYIQIDEDVLRDSMSKIQGYILTHAGQVKKVVPIGGVANA